MFKIVCLNTQYLKISLTCDKKKLIKLKLDLKFLIKLLKENQMIHKLKIIFFKKDKNYSKTHIQTIHTIFMRKVCMDLIEHNKILAIQRQNPTPKAQGNFILKE